MSSASGMLGVTMRTCGSSTDVSARTPSASSSRWPLDDITTGSATTRGSSSASMAATTASTMAAVANMPIFVALMATSPATVSICAVTRSAGSGIDAVMPNVLCAVTTVTALSPYTPNAAKVFSSACTPAPPLEGLPVFAASPGLPQGIARLIGPTGGYLLAYPAAALVSGYLAERGLDRRYATAVLAMIAGLAVIFTGGVAWIAYVVPPRPGLFRAIVLGLVPFVAADLLKVFLAAGVMPGLWWLSIRGKE